MQPPDVTPLTTLAGWRQFVRRPPVQAPTEPPQVKVNGQSVVPLVIVTNWASGESVKRSAPARLNSRFMASRKIP